MREQAGPYDNTVKYEPRETRVGRMGVHWVGPILLATFLCASQSQADQPRPTTGKHDWAFQGIDRAVEGFMDLIDCRAATLAISRDGELLHSRGFGWSDEGKRNAVSPDALMRIASVSKPITAAAIKQVIASGKLAYETPVIGLLEIEAAEGNIADPRVHQITVQHLLDHQGGWDRETSFDPMFRLARIEQELRLESRPGPREVIAFMLGQPLQFTPGERTAYSNFGYCMLGRVLEKVTGDAYFEAIQRLVCLPLAIRDIGLGRSDRSRRDPREVEYPIADDTYWIEVMDAHGGLVASAPALCQFLDGYWINGDRRPIGQRGNATFFGSLPGTTSMVRQRNDGINVAVLFNGRRNQTFREDNARLKRSIDAALDAIQ